MAGVCRTALAAGAAEAVGGLRPPPPGPSASARQPPGRGGWGRVPAACWVSDHVLPGFQLARNNIHGSTPAGLPRGPPNLPSGPHPRAFVLVTLTWPFAWLPSLSH